MTDPGKYGTYAVKSTTGIGGFSFSSKKQIEGNTSIDNVSVTMGSPTTVPEPLSLILLVLVLRA